MKREGTLAEQCMKDIALALKAKACYNPQLRVVSNNCKAMFEYYCKVAGWDNERLHQITDAERLIFRFPRLQIGFLEKIMGYRRIT